MPAGADAVVHQVAALAEEEALAALAVAALAAAEQVGAGKPLFRTCLNHETIRYFNT